ncbi:hypothetical protein PybrP1_007270 [[Pythium] brassicae (nom. inval.)]|nr:hypothetical protein PybrP1_007270 [[Pythium] brassicae (nom. inval.)]
MADTTANAPAPSPPPPPSKAELKQQERAERSLAFLERIERVVVTDVTFHDEHEQLQFRVIIKDSNEREAALSARAARKNAKSTQPTVTYNTAKALSTLRGVHTAVHQWTSKHPGTAALDGTPHCAYCSQFASPAALQLWKWGEPDAASANSGLTVVVSSSAQASRRLRRIEACLNEYLESARRTALLADEREQSECRGCTYIPVVVASFLQNEEFTSTPATVVLSVCSVM